MKCFNIKLIVKKIIKIKNKFRETKALVSSQKKKIVFFVFIIIYLRNIPLEIFILK
jgi:hypothetical protein